MNLPFSSFKGAVCHIPLTMITFSHSNQPDKTVLYVPSSRAQILWVSLSFITLLHVRKLPHSFTYRLPEGATHGRGLKRGFLRAQLKIRRAEDNYLDSTAITCGERVQINVNWGYVMQDVDLQNMYSFVTFWEYRISFGLETVPKDLHKASLFPIILYFEQKKNAVIVLSKFFWTRVEVLAMTSRWFCNISLIPVHIS